uniref:Homeobox domain-containing protein n=1 Tax=Panagrellus redivivus TaxID=6233 RepID=A0A7E4ZVA5_PANRE
MDSSALFNAYLNTVLRQTYAPMPYLLMPMLGLPMMPVNNIGQCPTLHDAFSMSQTLPFVKPVHMPSLPSTQPSPAHPSTHHVAAPAATAQPTIKPSRKSPFSIGILERKMTDAPSQSSTLSTSSSMVPTPASLPVFPMPSALPSEQSTQPLPPSQAPPIIKTRVEFTTEIKKILHDWFDAHLDYPYPSKDDVRLLTEKTLLSKTQVMTWCTNRRRSYEKQHVHVKWAKKAAPACAGKKRSAAQRDAAESAKKMARISIA